MSEKIVDAMGNICISRGMIFYAYNDSDRREFTRFNEKYIEDCKNRKVPKDIIKETDDMKERLIYLIYEYMNSKYIDSD